MTSQPFDARMVSPKDMVDDGMRFLIPLYQRLYVWKKEQVERLMDDIIAAWKRPSKQYDLYYLGGILAIPRTGKAGIKELELIDGQQRLTTLWLLALAWSDDPGVTGLDTFLRMDKGCHRLHFSVRDGANRFVETALSAEPQGSPETLAMEDALKVLRDYPQGSTEFELKKSDRPELANFILENVQLALTEVPPETDLNKLFEVINNRGEQLQHHDILKKRLLEAIKDDSGREARARIWDACAGMNDYVERNFSKVNTVNRDTIKDAVGRLLKDSPRMRLGSVQDALKAAGGGKSQEPQKLLSLEEILRNPPPETNGKVADGDSVEDDGASVESIISFPMLLQHTLRLYLQEARKTDIDHINDKDLLEIFDRHFFPASEEDAKAFLDKLWEARVAFDDYVVKWVEREEGDKQLHVRQIKPADGSYPRSVDGLPKGLALLQSVIYHSQGKTTQYWLTPFLQFCLKNPKPQQALVYLEFLDHCLFALPAGENQRQRTRRILEHGVPDHFESVVPKALFEDNGTDFRHYWFYKTEYVIWQKIQSRRFVPADWRLVSRNSVEHIYPQNDISGTNKAGPWLDKFPNLALMSREENSRLSNRGFEDKRARFYATDPASRSLKLQLLFDDSQYSSEALGCPQKRLQEHQAQLHELWRRYMGKPDGQVEQESHES